MVDADHSPAAADLRRVATQTGGTHHHAADATQLADVFMEFVNTFSVIDLLGQFGKCRGPDRPPLRQSPPSRCRLALSRGTPHDSTHPYTTFDHSSAPSRAAAMSFLPR